MGYVDLKTVFHQTNKQEYEELYKARYNASNAIHLNFEIAGYPAFFLEDVEVLKLAWDIAKTDKNVLMLSGYLPGVAKKQYSRRCLIDEIVLTNKIEGVHSSRKEIGAALAILEEQTKAKNRESRFLGLVNKYFKLLSKEDVPMNSCQDIRKIYDELFLEEVVGEDPNNKPDGQIFRKGPESVYNEAGREIHKGAYPEKKIIEYMDNALLFLNDEKIDGLYRTCLFHYLIEYIHPFYDGNGRLGRFFLSYSISKQLEPLVAYCVSKIIKEHIKEYYRAFSICNHVLNRADLTPFLIMQLTMINEAIHDLRDSLQEKMFIWQQYNNLLDCLPGTEKKNVANLYNYLIQASLFSESGISTLELKELLDVKSSTTLRNMLNQIPEHILMAQTKNRVKFYQLDLNALNEMLSKNKE